MQVGWVLHAKHSGYPPKSVPLNNPICEAVPEGQASGDKFCQLPVLSRHALGQYIRQDDTGGPGNAQVVILYRTSDGVEPLFCVPPSQLW
jgi:hypothetical protein